MRRITERPRRWARPTASRLLTQVVIQVAPPGRRRLEARLSDEVYLPLFGSSLRSQARRVPLALTARYLVFAAKRARLTALAPTPAGGRLYPQLSALRDAWIDRTLTMVCRRSPDALRQRGALDELARTEEAVRRGQAHPEHLRRLMELAPTESRLVRDLVNAHGQNGDDASDREPDHALREALWAAEVLAYAADDLAKFSTTVPVARNNVYAAFIDAYEDEAPDRLRAEITSYHRLFSERLEALDPQIRNRAEQLCERQFAAALGNYPPPMAARSRSEGEVVGQGVSTAVVLFGMMCVAGWLVAYVGIIRRGFADRTYGVPLPALVANLSWEFAYGFLLDPLGDYFHTSSIPGFLVDTVIAGQAWAYGPAQFEDSAMGRYFKPLFLLWLAVAFPVTYFGFLDLNDPDGEYTGFGINLMMSIIYIDMLTRRGSSAGQSMYIAVGKWLGTFCAWAATALTVTTTPDRTWPTSWRGFVRDSLRNRSYPLTPLVNVMYGWTFVLDAAYSVLLYRRLRAEGISPWRRF